MVGDADWGLANLFLGRLMKPERMVMRLFMGAAFAVVMSCSGVTNERPVATPQHDGLDARPAGVSVVRVMNLHKV